jgi:hypothetical protein
VWGKPARRWRFGLLFGLRVLGWGFGRTAVGESAYFNVNAGFWGEFDIY